ncbi:hypothetical protein VPH35_105775 [Triticum aestivum]
MRCLGMDASLCCVLIINERDQEFDSFVSRSKIDLQHVISTLVTESTRPQNFARPRLAPSSPAVAAPRPRRARPRCRIRALRAAVATSSNCGGGAAPTTVVLRPAPAMACSAIPWIEAAPNGEASSPAQAAAPASRPRTSPPRDPSSGGAPADGSGGGQHTSE